MNDELLNDLCLLVRQLCEDKESDIETPFKQAFGDFNIMQALTRVSNQTYSYSNTEYINKILSLESTVDVLKDKLAFLESEIHRLNTEKESQQLINNKKVEG
jgi:uncharacterized small protein (DUF1192 family)